MGPIWRLVRLLQQPVRPQRHPVRRPAVTAGQMAGQTAGQSSTEPLVPIVVQIEAQDTPSAIQGARPVIGSEQTMQSAQVYGTLRYFSGPPYTATLPSTAPLPYSAYTAPLLSTAPLPYAAMPAMSARPSLPMEYYGMPNPNWMISEREHALQQQLIQERQQFEAWKASQAQPQPQPPNTKTNTAGPVKVDDVDINKEKSVDSNKERSASAKRARPDDQGTSKAKRARSASNLADPPPLRGTTLGGLAQPQGHLRPGLDRQGICLLLPRTLKPLKLT